MIKFYQRWLSPALHQLLSPLTGSVHACRYQPTCSQYMSEAVAKYGIIRGGFMGLNRILRCNPLFAGGYDPVC